MAIRPVIRYASESWTFARKSESALYASERKVLRTFGPMRENSSWRIRYNNLLHKLSEQSNTSNIIKLERLKRAGHGLRLNGKRTPKMILESNIIGKRAVVKQRKYELMQRK
jgi:hypothetical protein